MCLLRFGLRFSSGSAGEHRATWDTRWGRQSAIGLVTPYEKGETRDQSAVGPPSPKPNLAVKRRSAEGTGSARNRESMP